VRDKLDGKPLASLAVGIQADIDALGLARAQLVIKSPAFCDFVALYDRLITSEPLRSATKKLYSDGHNARAVEEACKCLNNAVKSKSGTDLDGVQLMQTVFSEKNPTLKINQLKSKSDRDEQAGYMMIFAGCILGVRNPRAHEHELWDSPDVALELLVLVNHLMRTVEGAKRARRRKMRP